MTNLFILLILIFVILKKFNKFFYFIFYLFILICFLPVGQFLEYNLLSKKFYSLKNISNYDSVLVLGGYESRISHGLELIKKNKNSKIIFTGGSKYIFASKNQNEVLMFKFWLDDIDKQKIIITKNTRNTIENFKEFKKINNTNKFQNTILVTSPWHYKRSLLIANKLKLNVIPYNWPVEIKPRNIIQYYQTFNINKNLLHFNRFMREIFGIVVLYLYL